MACAPRTAPADRVNPVTREELDDITNVWVDAAFRLGDRDLKMMGRIVLRADAPHGSRATSSMSGAEAVAEERAAAG